MRLWEDLKKEKLVEKMPPIKVKQEIMSAKN